MQLINRTLKYYPCLFDKISFTYYLSQELQSIKLLILDINLNHYKNYILLLLLILLH